jgi:hypothetical protein
VLAQERRRAERHGDAFADHGVRLGCRIADREHAVAIKRPAARMQRSGG